MLCNNLKNKIIIKAQCILMIYINANQSNVNWIYVVSFHKCNVFISYRIPENNVRLFSLTLCVFWFKITLQVFKYQVQLEEHNISKYFHYEFGCGLLLPKWAYINIFLKLLCSVYQICKFVLIKASNRSFKTKKEGKINLIMEALVWHAVNFFVYISLLPSVHWSYWSGSRPLVSVRVLILDPHWNSTLLSCCCHVRWRSCRCVGHSVFLFISR